VCVRVRCACARVIGVRRLMYVNSMCDVILCVILIERRVVCAIIICERTHEHLNV